MRGASTAAKMTPTRFAIRSLIFHWRTNFAVALGVMAATAVLTGALVVGDSMYGSLRGLVLDRLGRVDATLVVPRFFREKLADEVAAAPGFQEHYTAALPAIVLQGTLENPAGTSHHRAGNVSVYGTTAEFWQLGNGVPPKPPTGDEIVLNQPLADQLHVKPGDEVVLQLSQVAEVPADSPLGRKTETVRSRRFTVSQVIPADGLGAFTLRPSQQLPLNAFTSLAPLQDLLKMDGKVNAILVAGQKDESKFGSSSSANEQGRVGVDYLNAVLNPTLADDGLSLRKTDRGYFNITSDRMLLEPALAKSVLKALDPDQAQPAYTYLANYILAGDGRGKIPYSTVAAINFTNQAPLGPFVNRQGEPISPLSDGEIVLNSWAADDLAAQGAPVKPGDTIELTYFEPESTHGKVVETKHSFRLKDIAKLAGTADDRDLTPEVKGVTDEASIANWNPPFPYDPTRVRAIPPSTLAQNDRPDLQPSHPMPTKPGPPSNQDDLYWQKYRATPKAFVSFEQGRKLWGSRFGDTTSIRIPAGDNITEQSLTQQLERSIDPKDLGFTFLPIKQLSLTAAAGTTPFAILFLAFSMFIIAAALMLIALLFKLGVDTRAAELGIVLAVGVRRRLARRMMLIEAALVAVIGSALGVAAGIGYAWLMLVGLKTWWLGAISTPFLQLYVDEHSVAHGFFLGVLVSLLTIVWALRQTRNVSVRRLLAGQFDEARMTAQRRKRYAPWIAGGLLLAALGLAFSAMRLTDEAQAGAFFGAGSLVLASLLTWLWDRLRDDSNACLVGGRMPLARLAVRNAARNPLRSTLTIGLVAAACFLIVAVSAFQLDPPSLGPTLNSGDGGFALIAQSDQPIYQDLNSTDARRELGFNQAAEQVLSGGESDVVRVFPVRVQSGDDASCLNLYQPRQPRILGVSQEFIERGGFAWDATAAATPEERADPWLLLNRKRNLGTTAKDASINDSEADIPVLLDQNTAMYSLHLYGGAGETFEIDNPRGGKIKLQVVGLLKNSIFQGELLISDENFERLFPDVSGYRRFLIESAAIAQPRKWLMH